MIHIDIDYFPYLFLYLCFCGRRRSSSKVWSSGRFVIEMLIFMIPIISCVVEYNTECNLALRRGLHILIKIYGRESKEVLMQRGRMLTYHVPDSEHSEGLSYQEYLEEL